MEGDGTSDEVWCVTRQTAVWCVDGVCHFFTPQESETLSLSLSFCPPSEMASSDTIVVVVACATAVLAIVTTYRIRALRVVEEETEAVRPDADGAFFEEGTGQEEGGA